MKLLAQPALAAGRADAVQLAAHRPQERRPVGLQRGLGSDAPKSAVELAMRVTVPPGGAVAGAI